jgi:hypothetical protein
LLAALLFSHHHGLNIPRSDEIATRHLTASGANKLRLALHPEPAGTACMSCHRGNTGQTVLIRALTAKGTWREQSQLSKHDFEICFAGGNRIIESIHADFGEIVQGWDGRRGWRLAPTEGARLLSAGEVQELRRDADFLSWPDSEHWTRTVRCANFAEKRCYRVDLIDEAGQQGARFFDVNTGLQVGMTWSSTVAGGSAATRLLSCYRDFGGLLVPATMTRIEPGRREIFDITSVVVANIAESRFTPPEPVRELLGSAPAKVGLRLN